MSLSIASTDNQNNTGLTVTVSGSDSGSTNTLYASPVFQGNNPLAWVSQGSRTGDGTIAASVATAYWFLYVAASLVSGVPALSPPIIGLASLAVQSMQTQVELAIQAKIQALTLNGLATPPGNIPASRVYRFDTPMSDDLLPMITVPCVIVSPPAAPEAIKNVVNTAEDIGFPVNVLILDHCAPRQQGQADTYKLWRQQISRAVRYQRLPGVPLVYTVSLEPKELLSWQPPKYEYVFSAMTFRAWVRDPRGA